MQATEKIWMNGDLVDWADAKIHVASHGLNYGSGVFEGIRCYDTHKGPAVFRLEEHLLRFENSARAPVHGAAVLDRGAPGRHARCRRRQRQRVVLHPSDRLLRIRRAGRLVDREPGRRRDHQLPMGRLPRRGQPDEGHHGEDLDLGARGTQRHSARSQGNGDLPQLDARDDGGAARRLRRGDHAVARRLHRRRPRGEHLRRQGRRAAYAATLDVDPSGDHARHDHRASRGIWATGSRRPS